MMSSMIPFAGGPRVGGGASGSNGESATSPLRLVAFVPLSCAFADLSFEIW